MSARSIRIRAAAWVGPSRRLEEARDIDIRVSGPVIEYPDSATPAEVEEILIAANLSTPQENGDEESN